MMIGTTLIDERQDGRTVHLREARPRGALEQTGEPCVGCLLATRATASAVVEAPYLEQRGKRIVARRQFLGELQFFEQCRARFLGFGAGPGRFRRSLFNRRRWCGHDRRLLHGGLGGRFARRKVHGARGNDSDADDARCDGEPAHPRGAFEFALDLGRGEPHEPRVDATRLLRIGAEQRAVADHVDEPGHAL